MAESRGDQAAGLRRLFGREQTRIVTFASGSAGVGKSVLVANLAGSRHPLEGLFGFER